LIRRFTLFLIVFLPLAAIAILLAENHIFSRQIIKTCFTDAGGLASGAQVRVAGVEIGSVRKIRVDPQRLGCPAEIEMARTTGYDVRIPKDSIVEVHDGTFPGATFVGIDTSHASGPPVEKYGYLTGKSASPPLSIQEYLRALEMAVRIAGASSRKSDDPAKLGSGTEHPRPRSSKP